MPTLIDSYSESNYNGGQGFTVALTKWGQSFTNVNSIPLDSCKFYLYTSGTPVGNITATIYAHSGTYGTSSLPTGSVLATSDNVDVATLTTSPTLINFNFSGVNRITLNALTYYVVVINYDGTATLFVGKDNSSLTASGNTAYYNGGAWYASATTDTCFYVYGLFSTPTMTGILSTTGVQSITF